MFTFITSNLVTLKQVTDFILSISLSNHKKKKIYTKEEVNCMKLSKSMEKSTIIFDKIIIQLKIGKLPEENSSKTWIYFHFCWISRLLFFYGIYCVWIVITIIIVIAYYMHAMFFFLLIFIAVRTFMVCGIIVLFNIGYH